MCFKKRSSFETAFFEFFFDEKMNIVKLLSRELFLLYMCLKINNIKSLIKFYPLNILYIKTDSLPLLNQTNVF
ncbi:hypothetical protein M104_3891 [Bacteroides fragilis str. 1007-1-F |uniref:Uncharacterized protein n=1 Tax=Bacteroides fragilis str. 1007-1-F \|nr:hypothetical protein M101_1706 [Bacteroides fragilis str. 1007-1-F \